MITPNDDDGARILAAAITRELGDLIDPTTIRVEVVPHPGDVRVLQRVIASARVSVESFRCEIVITGTIEAGDLGDLVKFRPAPCSGTIGHVVAAAPRRAPKSADRELPLELTRNRITGRHRDEAP
jgi:hypothetical protein